MEPIPVEQFLRRLAGKHRVLLIGGMAVIAHGRSRFTKDADIWLDPAASSQTWAEALLDVLGGFPGSLVVRIGVPEEVAPEELPDAAETDGVVRVTGFDRPCDVFRRPNELVEGDFGACWQRSAKEFDGVRILNELDLVVTKENTGRPQDAEDSSFLMQLVRRRIVPVARSGTLPEVEAVFAELIDHSVLEAALSNERGEVRGLAIRWLKELAAEGDPFAIEILEKRPDLTE